MDFNIKNTQIYSLDFSPDEKYLASSTDNGYIYIFKTSNQEQITQIPQKAQKEVITSVKWRRTTPSFPTKNVLTYGTSTGKIVSTHLNTK